MRLLAVRPARRCAICHGALAPDEGRACPACATRGHDPCLDEVGCPTLGCRARPTRLAAPFAAAPPVVVREESNLLQHVGLFCVGVLVVGLVALSQLESRMGCVSTCSRRERVRADMRAISDACDLFRIDTGRDPTFFDELWLRPVSATKWNGPYLKEYPPKDPWGNDYGIFNLGRRIVVESLGADGAPGGTDEAADLSSLTIND